MTAAAAANEWEGKGYEVYNPKLLPVAELPVIYGFNNGGSPGWLCAYAIAEDGTVLGSHVCSAEGYMPHDLGILKGSRPDRHETFRDHYPEGYRMDFVTTPEMKAGHEGLDKAIELNKLKAEEEKSNENR